MNPTTPTPSSLASATHPKFDQLPKLEDTLRRYLDSASVMVPPDAFNRTREVVAAFGAGEGAALHAELATLRDTVWKDTSYISEMWCV